MKQNSYLSIFDPMGELHVFECGCLSIDYNAWGKEIEFKGAATKVDKPRTNEIQIRDVIFNDPATIVLWEDGTKTVVKCLPDEMYDKEKGLAMAICKKTMGNTGRFNEVFKRYCWKDEE